MDLQSISNEILGIGVGVAKSVLRGFEERVANLTAFADIYNRVSSAQDVMYDIFEGDNDYSAGRIDTTKTRLNTGVSAGVTDLTSLVESTTGFVKGQEITIQDDANKEVVTVTKSDSLNVLTVMDRTTPISVVGSAYTTDTHARPVHLSNGWWISCARNSVDGFIYFYVSKDNGLTYNQICWSSLSSGQGFSMCSYGTKIYVFGVDNSPASTVSMFDATTITNVNISIANYKFIDSSQTSYGSGCSIAVNSTGTAWTLAWCSKNATYPNSFNIRSVKTTDFVTFTKQDGTAGVDQISTNNTSSYDCTNPYVQYDKNNIPVLFFQYSTTVPSNFIFSRTFSSGVWSGNNVIYTGGAYAQSNPIATLLTGGANAGRIVVAWFGQDSTDTTYSNIRCMYSDDNAINWVNFGVSTMKLTSGNLYNSYYPTVTSDKNGNVYVVFDGMTSASSGYRRIRTISWNGTVWSAIADLTTNTTAHMKQSSCCDNYKDFVNPITIWEDDVATKVQFYGKWNEYITTPFLQVTALAHAYKQYARVYRSLPTVDLVNHRLKFSSGFDGVTQYDRTTPVSVVGSAYTTVSTCRPQRLSNGWQVTAEINGTTDVKFQVSKDGGSTFNPLCYITWASATGLSICSYGTMIYCIVNSSAVGYFNIYKFDASTTANIQITSAISVDSSQTSFGSGCSIAVNSLGTAFTLAWCSKNATYPNSFNIRSVKTTDFVTFTKQDGSAGVDQLNTFNSAGTDSTNPYVQYDKNNVPIILYQYVSGSNYYIYKALYTSFWSANGTVFSGTTYTQSNPTATLLPSGRMVCVWHGLDSTDTSANNVRCMYSDDNCVTWNNFGVSTMKTTSGNTYNQMFPTVTSDKNGNIYVMWKGVTVANSSVSNIRQIIWNGATWGSITEITAQNVNNMLYPATCDNYKDFVNPITIWQDNQNTKVSFYGKWNEGVSIPLLSEDIRYNIIPKTGTAYSLLAWLERENDAGLTVTPSLSVVGSTADESFTAMTKSNTVASDGTHTKDEYMGNGTVNSKLTVKINMTRNVNSLDKAITKVLGSVA